MLLFSDTAGGSAGRSTESHKPAQTSDNKGQMSGFSGFVHFSPLYYSSRMAAADLSMAQAERNPPTTGQVTLAVGNGGDASEHPAPGCAGTRSATCVMPVERVLKPVLWSEIHFVNDFVTEIAAPFSKSLC